MSGVAVCALALQFLSAHVPLLDRPATCIGTITSGQGDTWVISAMAPRPWSIVFDGKGHVLQWFMQGVHNIGPPL